MTVHGAASAPKPGLSSGWLLIAPFAAVAIYGLPLQIDIFLGHSGPFDIPVRSLVFDMLFLFVGFGFAVGAAWMFMPVSLLAMCFRSRRMAIYAYALALCTILPLLILRESELWKRKSDCNLKGCRDCCGELPFWPFWADTFKDPFAVACAFGAGLIISSLVLWCFANRQPILTPNQPVRLHYDPDP